MQSPLISIIIPTYNRAFLLSETLNSVLAQTYKNWECIIIDDGSNDNTGDIIKRYLKKDKKFKFWQRSGKYQRGGCGARNEGMEKSTGDFIIFLDSDDLLSEDCLKKRIKYLQETNADDMLIFPTGLILQNSVNSDRIWNSLAGKGNDHISLVKSFLNQDILWHTNGVLWKKSFIQKLGGWDEDLKVWQDWELHIRALLAFPGLSMYNTEPDNFYRFKVSDSIAAAVNSKKYIQQAAFSISRINTQILQKNYYLKENLFALLIRNIILKPISLSFNYLPYKLIWSDYFIPFRRLSLYKIYIKRICMKSYRFRKITGLKLDGENLKKYYFPSTHLKLTSQFLNNEKIVINK